MDDAPSPCIHRTKVICPVCGNAMRSSSSTQGPGETGGLWRVDEHACDACGLTFTIDEVEKIGATVQRCSITLPTQTHSITSALACPSCASPLLAIVPTREPPLQAPNGPWSLRRRVVLGCLACRATYHREDTRLDGHVTEGALVLT